MVFAVVVDVPPVEATAAARTLETCNAALGPGQCALAETNPGAESAAHWYAVVRYGAQGQAKLTIELYEGNRGGNRVASSELEFKERDSPEERWASAGVVVAALVAAQPAPQSGAEPKPALPAPVPTAWQAVVNVQPPPTRLPPWLRLDLGLTLGSEVPGASLRVGPLGRFGIAFSSVPVFAFGSLAYTVQSSQGADLSWLTGSLGAGLRLGFARQRAALELRGEAVLETLGIQATDGERSESARRARFGPRLGLDLSANLSKGWAVVAGAEAGVLGPRVVIDVAGQTQELPPFVWGLISAVRYDFR
ncbi:MAG TPA: hypothetical protein VGJ91_23725 [Polyangiaceae bacterium]